jgi:hypothetical protein
MDKVQLSSNSELKARVLTSQGTNGYQCIVPVLFLEFGCLFVAVSAGLSLCTRAFSDAIRGTVAALRAT